MSGGPLLNAQGEVVAIAVSGAKEEWDRRRADE